MEKGNYIYGIRAVIEAIESGKNIDKVLMRRDLTGDLSRELLAKIREYGIVMQRVPQ
ncbi:MAG: 23S rRNA (guanosine(2251)-2'-O)-methyltransferase RlmB, partial [Muribaculaceae bacterium]|nr:23S rRNA (guanosine(2251)-2'-O)-methyltransferase RlmB [Muribaculaceae bacterium]